MTGGFLIALLFLWQATGRGVPTWTYVGIAALTLVSACFLAWRDAYRNYIVEPLNWLEQERSALTRFLKTIKNPNPQFEFYPLSPASAIDNDKPISEHDRNLIRLMTRMRDYTQRVAEVFQSRRIAYAGPLHNWGETLSSINLGALIQMLEDEEKYLDKEKQNLLRMGRKH